MNETIENNKLIAEFMCENNPYTRWNDVDSALLEYEMYGVIDCIPDGINEKHFFTPYEMLFNSSWDWLMPVVEKIWGIIGNRESLWYFDVSEITGEEMFISNNREYDGNNLADCYSAVVEFIKWYNSNSVS